MVSLLGKLALKSAVNIPHLELCATVLGVEISMIFKEQPDIATKDFQCYKAVELYLVISKTRRHFYIYVRNRIEQIYRFFLPIHWNHVPSKYNPADYDTKLIYQKR